MILIKELPYLLGKKFDIFSLPTFSRNLSNKIRENQKFYFYNSMIMNA